MKSSNILKNQNPNLGNKKPAIPSPQKLQVIGYISLAVYFTPNNNYLLKLHQE